VANLIRQQVAVIVGNVAPALAVHGFGELRRLGYVEGDNLLIERYSAEGHHERYAALAREIVSGSPDVIVTGTNPVVTTLKAATSTIPIVAFMLDPLKAGLVTSLSRPGGNLTGITLDPGLDIWGKRLEMLKEAIPSTAKAVVLGMREGWEGSSGQTLRYAGGRLSGSSLQSSSNGRTQCWSAGKATFMRTAN
jgi:putative ABC transport system substrate-binding protein